MSRPSSALCQVTVSCLGNHTISSIFTKTIQIYCFWDIVSIGVVYIFRIFASPIDFLVQIPCVPNEQLRFSFSQTFQFFFYCLGIDDTLSTSSLFPGSGEG